VPVLTARVANNRVMDILMFGTEAPSEQVLFYSSFVSVLCLGGATSRGRTHTFYE